MIELGNTMFESGWMIGNDSCDVGGDNDVVD